MARISALIAVAGLAVLPLGACGGDDTAGTTIAPLVSEPPTTTGAADTSAPPDTAADTSAPPDTAADTSAPADTAPDTAPVDMPTFPIDVSVVGGQPEGGVRSYLVEVGQIVEITITSDTADEAHLHGYDLEAALEPGVPSTITFTADTAGGFEMELHESGALLFYLDVA